MLQILNSKSFMLMNFHKETVQPSQIVRDMEENG